MTICDCERGHNGLGMSGRECDCGPAMDAKTEALHKAIEASKVVWDCWPGPIDASNVDRVRYAATSAALHFAALAAPEEQSDGLVVKASSCAWPYCECTDEDGLCDDSPAGRAPAMDAKTEAGAWPEGCIKRSSCARHLSCVYGGPGTCSHFGREIRDQVDRVDRLLAAPEGKAEPVAWRWRFDDIGKANWHVQKNKPPAAHWDDCVCEPLFASPPRADLEAEIKRREATASREGFQAGEKSMRERAAKVSELYGQGKQGMAASKAIAAAIRALSSDDGGPADAS